MPRALRLQDTFPDRLIDALLPDLHHLPLRADDELEPLQRRRRARRRLELLVRAEELRRRLLDDRHPEDRRVGALGKRRRAVGAARQTVVDEHALPVVVRRRVVVVEAHDVKAVGAVAVVDERRAHNIRIAGDDVEGSEQPSVVDRAEADAVEVVAQQDGAGARDLRRPPPRRHRALVRPAAAAERRRRRREFGIFVELAAGARGERRAHRRRRLLLRALREPLPLDAEHRLVRRRRARRRQLRRRRERLGRRRRRRLRRRRVDGGRRARDSGASGAAGATTGAAGARTGATTAAGAGAGAGARAGAGAGAGVGAPGVGTGSSRTAGSSGAVSVSVYAPSCCGSNVEATTRYGPSARVSVTDSVCTSLSAYLDLATWRARGAGEPPEGARNYWRAAAGAHHVRLADRALVAPARVVRLHHPQPNRERRRTSAPAAARARTSRCRPPA